MKMDELNDKIAEAMKIRSGMYDSLIFAFMSKTGLSVEDIMLVEQRMPDEITYFYAKRKDKNEN